MFHLEKRKKKKIVRQITYLVVAFTQIDKKGKVFSLHQQLLGCMFKQNGRAQIYNSFLYEASSSVPFFLFFWTQGGGNEEQVKSELTAKDVLACTSSINEND